MTVEGSRGDAQCAHSVEERGDDPASLFSVRTLLIATLAVVIGLFVGLAAGVSAGIGTSQAGTPAAVAVGIVSGIGVALVAGLGASASLHALVGRKH